MILETYKAIKEMLKGGVTNKSFEFKGDKGTYTVKFIDKEGKMNYAILLSGATVKKSEAFTSKQKMLEEDLFSIISNYGFKSKDGEKPVIKDFSKVGKMNFEFNDIDDELLDFNDFKLEPEEFSNYFGEISYKIKTENDKNFASLIAKYVSLDYEDYFKYGNKNRKKFKLFRGSSLFKGSISEEYVYRGINIENNEKNEKFIKSLKTNLFFPILSEDDCFQSFSCNKEIAESFAQSKSSYSSGLDNGTIGIILKINIKKNSNKYVFDYKGTNSDMDEAEVAFYFDIGDKIEIDKIIE